MVEPSKLVVDMMTAGLQVSSMLLFFCGTSSTCMTDDDEHAPCHLGSLSPRLTDYIINPR
jgi:hypothetical protein